jgi:hypothetical protein
MGVFGYLYQLCDVCVEGVCDKLGVWRVVYRHYVGVGGIGWLQDYMDEVTREGRGGGNLDDLFKFWLLAEKEHSTIARVDSGIGVIGGVYVVHGECAPQLAHGEHLPRSVRDQGGALGFREKGNINAVSVEEIQNFPVVMFEWGRVVKGSSEGVVGVWGGCTVRGG